MNATSFEFDPAEIEVSVGKDVAIVLRSDDILHDFAIEELGVHVATDRGETDQGVLRIDEAGQEHLLLHDRGAPPGKGKAPRP